MKVTVSIQMDVDLCQQVKRHVAEKGVSLSRFINEILLAVLNDTGVIDPELISQIERNISKGPGRPIDEGKRTKRKEDQEKVQEKIYSGAGLSREQIKEMWPGARKELEGKKEEDILPPTPICARCGQVVKECKCPEGPEEI